MKLLSNNSSTFQAFSGIRPDIYGTNNYNPVSCLYFNNQTPQPARGHFQQVLVYVFFHNDEDATPPLGLGSPW